MQPASPPMAHRRIQTLIGTLPSVTTVERHDESKTPFQKQLGWHHAPDNDSLIPADRIFIKHGYSPSPETIEYLKSLKVDRVLVCGLQTEICCLAAGLRSLMRGCSRR